MTPNLFGITETIRSAMNQIVDTPCPLWHSTARCEEHMMRRLKHIICPSCKEFVIKYKAEAYLATSTQQTKDYFAAGCASAPTGLIPLLHFEPNGAGAAPTVKIDYLEIEEALHR